LATSNGGGGGGKPPRAPQLTVEVTAQHIADARRRNSGHCMSAEAMKDALRARGINPESVSVDVQTMRFSDPAKGLRYIYLSPRIVQKNAIVWDQGDDVPEEDRVKPFQFRLSGAVVINMQTGKGGPKGGAPGPATLVVRKGNRVSRAGGKPPPKISMRREYGLRAFDR
jgi:hypothetical protein